MFNQTDGKRERSEENEREACAVITVRLPKSFHEELRAEAHRHHTSMNKLCLSKLAMSIETENVLGDGVDADKAWRDLKTRREAAAVEDRTPVHAAGPD